MVSRSRKGPWRLEAKIYTDVGDLDDVLRHINAFVAQQGDLPNYNANPQVDESVNQAMARMIPDQLALAASAATEILPKTEDGDDMLHNLSALSQPSENAYFEYQPVNDGSGPLDPQLQHGNTHMPPQTLVTQPQMAISRPAPLQQRSVPANNNLPHAQFLHDFRLNGDPHKSKTRGRFTAIRRKEVQEVRRQGACIRCRMLKKPVGVVLRMHLSIILLTGHSAPVVRLAPHASMLNLHVYGSHHACEHE